MNTTPEPKTAPQPDRWYNLTLGPSFKDKTSSKYCTLRYDFKPASIDKTKPGTLKKTKGNRVSVEFQNSQPGKPNKLFKGSSEDYHKDNDAVLFFDGQTFRLERLHRAVNQLRHDRDSDESGGIPEPQLSPPPPPGKVAKTTMHPARNSFPSVPVEVERIDIGVPENQGAKSAAKGLADYSSEQPNVSAASPDPKNDDVEEHHDIDIDELFGSGSPEDENAAPEAEEKSNVGFDINMPHQDDIDDEIADIDDSGDEVDKGPNAAEALRAQVNAEERQAQTSSSSSSGDSDGSSGSTASSSSSSTDGSDDDSQVNSI